jgi:hypothetical protein
MNITVYDTALVTHIVGITMLAGTTFIDFVTFRHFWKIFPDDKTKGFVIGDILYRLQRFMGIGMLLILASGILMMAYMHQVWGEQTWFRIKMGVLLLVIINGLAFRRTLGTKLKRLMTEIASGNTTGNVGARLSMLKGRITIVHILQILFFITIFTLSVFKFN